MGGPTEEAGTKRKNTSAPPQGYVCKLCGVAGHWIQQCPEREKQGRKRRKKKSSDHVPVTGVDPSEQDIDAAREMQKIPPPNCRCGERSRLKKVKKSKVDEQSRANGRYFFFCAKAREESCSYARPAEDELRKRKCKMDKEARKKNSSVVVPADKRSCSENDSPTQEVGLKSGKCASLKESIDGRSSDKEKEKSSPNKPASDHESSSTSDDETDSSSDGDSSSSEEMSERGKVTKESKGKDDDAASSSSSESDSSNATSSSSSESDSSSDSNEDNDQVF
eukprot:CAMPEP_0113565408 /NCGR_PEP_ID=MMETSP0015_2-20120614/22160_1 /TAXON_ID=2838 /ORGANISM="Odontella" /LENGTH=278 /DNA_ID=CAMNT_0000467601 /DNA_START=135 /DNA_END=971 /DNA_ORIENTATION=+ /assembly_acc=CAM_ASM_000160